MNKRLYFIYRFLTIASLACGLILNLINTYSPSTLMAYYTMQSNLLCLLVFIFFPMIMKNHKNLYYIGKGAITIAILLTATIYLVALLPNDYSMCTTSTVAGVITSKAIGNLLVHVISPICVTLDYFLFDEKGNFNLYYPWLWLIIPLMYVGFVYIFHSKGKYFYGIGGSRNFAYFFLDYQKIGIKGVVGWIIGISIFVILLGYLLFYIDKKLAKKRWKAQQILLCLSTLGKKGSVLFLPPFFI